MIIKSFELDKIDLKTNKIFLLYGENQGAKDELIQSIINQKKIPTFKYHENEVINNGRLSILLYRKSTIIRAIKAAVIDKIRNKSHLIETDAAIPIVIAPK